MSSNIVVLEIDKGSGIIDKLSYRVSKSITDKFLKNMIRDFKHKGDKIIKISGYDYEK